MCWFHNVEGKEDSWLGWLLSVLSVTSLSGMMGCGNMIKRRRKDRWVGFVARK